MAEGGDELAFIDVRGLFTDLLEFWSTSAVEIILEALYKSLWICFLQKLDKVSYFFVLIIQPGDFQRQD